MPIEKLEEVFGGKVRYAGNCWEWTGTRNQKGYGQIASGGCKGMAHRIAWTLANGPIPDGLCVLHRCDNPPCINPAHLWLGTVADNNLDKKIKGRGRGKCSDMTHCSRGHPYDPENVYTCVSEKRGLLRYCRTCTQMRGRQRRKPHLPQKTHCPQGHAYDEANTYYAKSSPNHRLCRACGRERGRNRHRLISAAQREYSQKVEPRCECYGGIAGNCPIHGRDRD
jgi:hypothetical protein